MDLLRATMTEQVKQAALAAGCDGVGIAPATAPPGFDRFEAALAAGYHADLAWLARPDSVAKRRDPALLLPGARSLVMVAAAYGGAAAPSGQPALARYAQGEDYHRWLPARLEPVVELIGRLGGDARVCVDSAALLEVSHAARAGLGWVGKHGLLLDRRLGSWLLLGAVLTTLDLLPDEPQREHCGTCARCLAACPTGALVEPYVLDARRCLSYLTIEHRGTLAPELRRQVGQWVFGCDLCQEVCPWNRSDVLPAPPGEVPALEPPSVTDLAAWLSLTEPAFRARFGDTPLARPKRRGLLRNACVVLGNLGATDAVPALRSALQDEEPLVREHAAWALAQLGESVAGDG